MGLALKVTVDMNRYDEGTKICLHCGLCCLGFFHSMVKLKNSEEEKSAVQIGCILMENQGKTWARLPCPAYDGSCSIFYSRPFLACASYKCKLLKCVEKDSISVEKAKIISDEMKLLCQRVNAGLDELAGPSDTTEIHLRMYRLFSENPDASKDSDFKRKYSLLRMQYAAYRELDKKYFNDS